MVNTENRNAVSSANPPTCVFIIFSMKDRVFLYPQFPTSSTSVNSLGDFLSSVSVERSAQVIHRLLGEV